MSSKSEGTTSRPRGSVPFSDRISSLFGRSAAAGDRRARQPRRRRKNLTARASTSGRARRRCWSMQVRPPERMATPSACAIRARFVRAARECRVTGNMVNIRIGIEGRVILGPAGGPGQVSIPLRYRAGHRDAQHLRSRSGRSFRSSMSMIPPQTAHVNFTHIAEDLTVPIPPAAELENWVIYIGFDPTGAQLQQRRPARRRGARSSACRIPLRACEFSVMAGTRRA